MTQGKIRGMVAAENAPRLVAGELAASRQHARRVIAMVHGSARIDVVAAEKAHLRRAARQKNFKAAIVGGTKQHDRGGVARANHERKMFLATGGLGAGPGFSLFSSQLAQQLLPSGVFLLV